MCTGVLVLLCPVALCCRIRPRTLLCPWDEDLTQMQTGFVELCPPISREYRMVNVTVM